MLLLVYVQRSRGTIPCAQPPLGPIGIPGALCPIGMPYALPACPMVISASPTEDLSIHATIFTASHCLLLYDMTYRLQ